MTLARFGRLTAAFIIAVLGLGSSAEAQNPLGMRVIGYADRLSVQPGETVRFMVSSELPQYRADIVRLIHGDTNPTGPGFKEEAIDVPVNKEYPGRFQPLGNGSYATVPDSPALRLTGSFTLQAWIYPTTPNKSVQGLITKWSASDNRGYALVIEADGTLGLWIGDADGKVVKVKTDTPLLPSTAHPYDRLPPRPPVLASRWYFVAASYDAAAGRVTLIQEPAVTWPLMERPVVVERPVSVKGPGPSEAPLLMAAYWEWREAGSGIVGGYYNGKIDSPRVYGRALTRAELDALKAGTAPATPVAAWDFAADPSSRQVSDTSANKLHGRTVNLPARAMTGHNWSGKETNFKLAAREYAAIHFHDDDLDDATWKSDFELKVPETLKSGVYAARLRAGNAEDYVPFYVRPKKGTASSKIAFLVPTFSYLAYANSGSGSLQLLSPYDHHTDGSGVAYSSFLRPIVNMRPKYRSGSPYQPAVSPHQFNADLHLLDWLEVKGYKYDVITDHDLDAEGSTLLAPYKVILTGTHPEYWSLKMLDSMKGYLENGGRLMYLGGNGFYWVTAQDPSQRHTVEVRRWGGTQAWTAEPGENFLSSTGELGGLWRARGRAPQALVGVGFSAQGGGNGVPFRRQPGSFDPRAAFIFEGIGPTELIGDNPSLARVYGAGGNEVDRYDISLGTPAHALLLATTERMAPTYVHVVEEIPIMNNGPLADLVKGDLVFFEYPKGGAVFSASSISWCGSLSNNNYTNTVSRLTENVLKRFAADGPLPGAAPAGASR